MVRQVQKECHRQNFELLVTMNFKIRQIPED